jgi:hypothetical protein
VPATTRPDDLTADAGHLLTPATPGYTNKISQHVGDHRVTGAE